MNSPQALLTLCSVLISAPICFGQAPTVLERPDEVKLTFVQTDWSGGLKRAAANGFGNTFETANLSWRSVPGQLALSCTYKSVPFKQVISDTHKVPKSISVADIDGDGVLDLLSARPVSQVTPFKLGAFYWWKVTGPGQWTPIEISGDFYGAFDQRGVDMDGDGDIDVVACSAYGNADPRNGRFVWFENLGAGLAWIEHPIANQYWGVEDLEVADMDGDGDLDVVSCTPLNYSVNNKTDVFWFENRGDNLVWTAHEVENDWPAALSIDLADMDGDGDLDMVANSYGVPDNVCWWENLDGKANMGTRQVIEQQLVFSSKIVATDIDEDGDMDVLGASLNFTPLAAWENTAGDGSQWNVGGIGQQTAFGWSEILSVDLDGDGDLDVIGGAESGITGHRIAWWENNGLAISMWPEHTLVISGAGSNPSLVAVDLDNDGRLEIAASVFAASASHLFVWQVNDFQSAGELTSKMLDGKGLVHWNRVEWDATVPSGTDLTISVRSGSGPLSMGPWVRVPTSGASIGGALNPPARFFQYRVQLSSSSPDLSPILREVRVCAD